MRRRERTDVETRHVTLAFPRLPCDIGADECYHWNKAKMTLAGYLMHGGYPLDRSLIR